MNSAATTQNNWETSSGEDFLQLRVRGGGPIAWIDSVGNPQGNLAFGTSLAPKNISNIRFVDNLNSAGWSGADAGAWIASAIADLPSGGGIVDARGLGANVHTISSQLRVGDTTNTKAVSLLIDRGTRFNVNVVGGVDAIQVFNACSIIGVGGVGGSLGGLPSSGGFYLGPSANVSSLVANGTQDGTQEFMFLENCYFQGNQTAVCSDSIGHFKRVFVNSGVRNCVFSSAMTTPSNVHIEGCSVFMWDNNWIIGSQGVSGFTTIGMLINGTSGQITLLGGAIEHSAGGKPLLSIDSTTGFGSGPGSVNNISILNTYFEGQKVGTETGTTDGIDIINVNSAYIVGVTFGGNISGGDAIKISETASGISKNIVLESVRNGTFVNSVNDTTSTGQIVTDASFARYVNNATSYNFNVSLNDGTLRRILATKGTSLVAGDFVLSGWGTGASVAVTSGSTDTRGQITVTVGTAPAPNPTTTLTFKNGAFAVAPFAIAKQQGGTQPLTTIEESTTTTTLVITFVGTPIVADTVIITWICLG
ncbi:Uncharacterised protein [uncultured archaeon]|nr:Uncharacterised protein [uncultured archaeon]